MPVNRIGASTGIFVDGRAWKSKAALSAYTGDAFRDLNRGLRNKDGLTAEQRVLVSDLSAALKKLPAYQGTVYRGVGLKSEAEVSDIAERLNNSRTEGFPAFTSTSTSREVARHYAGDGPRVLYSIESKRGRYLSDYSASATTPKSNTEREVLFDRRSRYIVQSSRRDGETLHISLREK